jgi:periplasmic divalent cation tolerance protein
MKLNWVYITASDREEALRIGRALVESRLAACANLIDGMKSIYWWGGEIQEDDETILIAKTRESLLPQLVEMVKSIHSYDCPCIISLPILDGNPDYLGWLGSETQPSTAQKVS